LRFGDPKTNISCEQNSRY